MNKLTTKQHQELTDAGIQFTYNANGQFVGTSAEGVRIAWDAVLFPTLSTQFMIDRYAETLEQFLSNATHAKVVNVPSAISMSSVPWQLLATPVEPLLTRLFNQL